MSNEKIVATALYVLHRDDEVVGGDILFKRAFHSTEASYIFSSVNQIRPAQLDDMISDGLMPLGKVQAHPGRLIVFPNSHVHKVRKIRNQTSTDTIDTKGSKEKTEPGIPLMRDKHKVAKRRIVVFFLVDPERRIISTKEVPPQQQIMTRESVFENRRQPMTERKFMKQDWNVRQIELCEH